MSKILLQIDRERTDKILSEFNEMEQSLDFSRLSALVERVQQYAYLLEDALEDFWKLREALKAVERDAETYKEKILEVVSQCYEN